MSDFGVMSHEIPEIILPQLATLSPEGPPAGSLWLHEIKLDGFRLLCRKDYETVDFYTRNGHRWTHKFPAIANEVRSLKAKQLWLDGELVVMTEEGRSCFGSLQKAVAKKDQECLAFHAFDLMWLEADLCEEPLEKRKQLLSEVLHGSGWKLGYVDYQKGYGPEFFEAACQHGLEGVVSKRGDSPYRAASRTRAWVKSKSKSYDQKPAWKWWEGR